MAVRLVLVGLVCGCAMLACREIEPFPEPSPPITGYQFSGTVTTLNGMPVEGAGVQLYYSFDWISSTPLDTERVVVRDTIRLVDVTVVTPRYEIVRVLLLGHLPPGEVPRLWWDTRDNSGTLVPSGKYLIRYTIDSTVVKYTSVIVNGHSAGSTNAAGKFTLSNEQLPIGEMMDWYAVDGTFVAVYAVRPEITLEFRKGDRRIVYESIVLQRNQLTTGAFTL